MEHRNLPGLLVFLELVSGASSARAVVDDDEEQGCAGRGEERAVLRWPRGQGAHTRSSSSDKATGTDGALSNEVVRRLELLPGVLRSPTRSSSTVQHHLALALPSPKSGGKGKDPTPPFLLSFLAQVFVRGLFDYKGFEVWNCLLGTIIDGFHGGAPRL
jgi:hypothetical protein